MRGGQLLGDLVAGVAAADDEHPAVGDVGRLAVVGAVDLRDVAGEPLCNRRGRGFWNGPVATMTWAACSVRSASPTR